MSVETVLASAVKPEVFSYTRLASSTKAEGRRYPRQVRLAQDWCELRGPELADDARHRHLSEADAGPLQALDSLRMELGAGRISKDCILVLEGLNGVTRGDLRKAISAFTALVWQGLEVVVLTEAHKVWTTSSMRDSRSFVMSIVVLFRAEEARRMRSMRARNGSRKEVK